VKPAIDKQTALEHARNEQIREAIHQSFANWKHKMATNPRFFGKGSGLFVLNFSLFLQSGAGLFDRMAVRAAEAEQVFEVGTTAETSIVRYDAEFAAWQMGLKEETGMYGFREQSVSIMKYKKWPDDDGFLANFRQQEMAEKGKILSRIGGLSKGRFVSPPGTSLSERGLPLTYPNKSETLWEVLRPFKMEGGIAAPWQGAKGFGIQYKLEKPILQLWREGFIRPFRP